MIKLTNVGKHYQTRNGMRTILHGVELSVRRGEKIGILGRNGAGKSTLIRLISGAELPTTGQISRQMSVSWPLALAGGFQGSLTGLDNVRFVCRVYGVAIREAVAFVHHFTELGEYLLEPVRNYSAGMRARLAFALSMAIEFDCFLIDEVIAVGDQRFHEKCQYELFEKRRDRALIMVSHDVHIIRERCDRALVLHEGVLHDGFNDIDQAYHYYGTR